MLAFVKRAHNVLKLLGSLFQKGMKFLCVCVCVFIYIYIYI